MPLSDTAVPRSLLLVDDEENILASLKRLLRHDGYHILTAACAEDALTVLEAQPVGVVISDQRMPSMSGVELLSLVKRRWPDTVRMMLSGYTELNAVTASINKGEIYKFLTKPWDDGDLREVVRAAFEQYAHIRDGNRLARDLRQANTELSRAKQVLEQDLKEKEHDAVLHRRALRTAQTILEHLPVAVVGVDEDGVIACANRMAHDQLGAGGTGLLGADVRRVLPAALLSVVREGAPHMQRVQLDGGRQAIACCSTTVPGGSINGRILVFTCE